MTRIVAAVLTISDRASAGVYQDASGPLAVRLLDEHGIDATLAVVPDDTRAIRDGIVAAIAAGARFVLTCGGTGVGPRDVTPEATAPLLDQTLPGVIDAVRRHGTAHVPTAALSRATAGIVRPTTALPAFVVNAPGSSGGVRDTVTVVAPLVAHVLDQLAGGDHPRSG